MKNCQEKIAEPDCQSTSPVIITGRVDLHFIKSSARKLRSRSAITSIDIIVSTVLLGAVLSTATSLCFRINQIWKGISHQRVATQELANQLDGLTRLNAEEVKFAIQTLQASEPCSRSLHDPKLSGEVTEDELGLRVTLRISWEASPQPLQAELSGWLIHPKTTRAVDSTEPLGKEAEPNSSSDSDPDQTQTSNAFKFSTALEDS